MPRACQGKVLTKSNSDQEKVKHDNSTLTFLSLTVLLAKRKTAESMYIFTTENLT